MTGQVTPSDITRRLWALGHELDQVTVELEGIEEAAVLAREAYVVAKETSLLNAPDDYKYQYQREAHSKLASSVERVAAELADAKVRVARARIACIKSRIDIGRSSSAALREEMRLA